MEKEGFGALHDTPPSLPTTTSPSPSLHLPDGDEMKEANRRASSIRLGVMINFRLAQGLK
jgi:hypothetical protein